jgi:thiamine pyrophosphate-dependent acetolactate synthase large subunit-like protein
MGLSAFVVTEPGGMQNAVRAALATHGPCVIEVRVDPNRAPPLGDRAKTIAGFTKS